MAATSKKKVSGYIKLEIPAGKANPSPPVGPALGQRGVNIMEFCKAFNEATKSMEPEAPVPVVITVYADRSFSFVTRRPPVSYLLKKVASLSKGSSVPNRDKVGTVTMAQVREVAEAKREDMNVFDLEAAMRMIAGSARSMGIDVKD